MVLNQPYSLPMKTLGQFASVLPVSSYIRAHRQDDLRVWSPLDVGLLPVVEASESLAELQSMLDGSEAKDHGADGWFSGLLFGSPVSEE